MRWLNPFAPKQAVELEDLRVTDESGPMYPVYYLGTFVGDAWKPDQGAVWALLTVPAPIGLHGYLFH